ncbi:hypothetical protein Rt10032_c11g4594 [Rhodotorula toruloides]|uniref:GET complex, subunit GET2 n=1 Tax=Rhodotorula toruloides TaxID=5286 RepID=A0A511KJM1_RHOTO|nr:hypothetical protein Rt10032_c11g4594 [Rhodotorula toruloides]
MSSETLSPAAQRAAARQAKLLARGKERLDKLTGAAKGEGRVVSGSVGGIAPRPANVNPPPPSTLADVNQDDDPAEVDLAAQSPLALFGGTGPAGAGFPGAGAENPFAAAGAGGDDMFAQMLSQMMAGAGGAQAGAGGVGAGPPAGASPFMQGPPVSPFPPAPKTFLDRIFPALHFFAMVGLAAYVVAVYEPAKRLVEYGWTGARDGIDWASWGALISRKPREAGIVADAIGLNGLAEVPLLWMFVSVELVLQTTRLFLLRNRPAPPGIINSLLPMLSQFSPQLAVAIQAGVRYLDIFSTLLNDLSVLIFCIGIVALVGRWKTGEPTGFVEVLADKTKEMLTRASEDL